MKIEDTGKSSESNLSNAERIMKRMLETPPTPHDHQTSKKAKNLSRSKSSQKEQ